MSVSSTGITPRAVDWPRCVCNGENDAHSLFEIITGPPVSFFCFCFLRLKFGSVIHSDSNLLLTLIKESLQLQYQSGRRKLVGEPDRGSIVFVLV